MSPKQGCWKNFVEKKDVAMAIDLRHWGLKRPHFRQAWGNFFSNNLYKIEAE